MVKVLVKLIVLTVLVYAGVSILYGSFEKTLRQSTVVISERAEKSSPPVEKTEIQRQPNDYSVIVERNIFQAALVKVEKGKDEDVVETKPVEPTKLKLSLMGTISGNERDARAIISDDMKRQQDIYQVGDSIQGAIIKSIERGKVVLNVNNRDEVLTLADREGGGPAYQPSPADFFEEPQEEPQEIIPEEPQEVVQEEPQEPPTEPDMPPQYDEGSPPPVQGPPQIRPRPIRRSLHLRQRPGDGDGEGEGALDNGR